MPTHPSYIPEGTTVKFPHWAIHHDPRNFSYPQTFWPERWLIASDIEPCDEKIVHNETAFIPFSAGPYACVGKNVGQQEMRMLLCHFVQTLDFRFADGYDPSEYVEAMRDKFAMMLGPLPTIVTRRK
jgi:cytochrome P450